MDSIENKKMEMERDLLAMYIRRQSAVVYGGTSRKELQFLERQIEKLETRLKGLDS